MVPSTSRFENGKVCFGSLEVILGRSEDIRLKAYSSRSPRPFLFEKRKNPKGRPMRQLRVERWRGNAWLELEKIERLRLSVYLEEVVDR